MKRHSAKRDAILECLRSTTAHPTAEWIYTRLKPAFPHLSLATVYRNLSEMKRDGLIRSVGTVDGQERFDGTVAPHTHAVCSVCGKVIDVFPVSVPDGIIGDAERLTGFSLERAEMRFTGICPDCIGKKKENKNG